MTLDFRVERDADQARDAVEIELPIKPDRSPVRRYEIVEIAPGATKTLPAAAAEARAGHVPPRRDAGRPIRRW